jgi:hypothetical protein
MLCRKAPPKGGSVRSAAPRAGQQSLAICDQNWVVRIERDGSFDLGDGPLTITVAQGGDCIFEVSKRCPRIGRRWRNLGAALGAIAAVVAFGRPDAVERHWASGPAWFHRSTPPE